MSTTPLVAAIACPRADFHSLSAALAGTGIRTSYVHVRSNTGKQACLPEVAVIICDADHVDWAAALLQFQMAHPNSPVIFLTRLADEHVWLDMLQAGAYDLLQKPCRAQDLQWVVCSALKRARHSNRADSHVPAEFVG